MLLIISMISSEWRFVALFNQRPAFSIEGRLILGYRVLMWHLGMTGTWLHGEAVSAGIVMAADLSHRSGWIEADVLDRTRALLLAARLPVEPPKVPRFGLTCINGLWTADKILSHASNAES